MKTDAKIQNKILANATQQCLCVCVIVAEDIKPINILNLDFKPPPETVVFTTQYVVFCYSWSNISVLHMLNYELKPILPKISTQF